MRSMAGQEGSGQTAEARRPLKPAVTGWGPGCTGGSGKAWPLPNPHLPSTGKPPKAFGGALGALGYPGEETFNPWKRAGEGGTKTGADGRDPFAWAWERGSPAGNGEAGAARHLPFLLLPLTQMLRAGRGPGTLHAHPGQAWLSLPKCLSLGPYLLQGGAKGKRRDEERTQRGRERERMEEMMAVLELEKSEGWAGGPRCPGWAGRAEPATWHRATPLLKDTDSPLGVCGAGPSNDAQRRPREPQLPTRGCSGCAFPFTPIYFPPQKLGSRGQGGERQRGGQSDPFQGAQLPVSPHLMLRHCFPNTQDQLHRETSIPDPLGCSLPPGGGSEPHLALAGVGTAPGPTSRQWCLDWKRFTSPSPREGEGRSPGFESQFSHRLWMCKTLPLTGPQFICLMPTHVYRSLLGQLSLPDTVNSPFTPFPLTGAALSHSLKNAQMQ